MPDDNEISFGIEALDEAFYSGADWDMVPASDWQDVDFDMNDVIEAFWNGFIDAELESDARYDAREEFFEYMELLGFDAQDFDWDAWREAMGY